LPIFTAGVKALAVFFGEGRRWNAWTIKSPKNKNMKMKTALVACIVNIFAIASPHCVQAQSDYPEEQAVEMVKVFYTSYIRYVDKGDLSKLELLQKKYCTPKLFKKIPELGDKNDQDPFLKAQDSNIKFLKSLVVEKDNKKEGHYVVSYGIDEKTLINLTVLKINGNYKIANVW
jgi:Protein of unknown function (DUF3828)